MLKKQYGRWRDTVWSFMVYCIMVYHRDLLRSYRLTGKGMGQSTKRIRSVWDGDGGSDHHHIWPKKERLWACVSCFSGLCSFPFLVSQWIASSCSKHVQEASVASRCSDRLRLRAKHIAALEGSGQLQNEAACGIAIGYNWMGFLMFCRNGFAKVLGWFDRADKVFASATWM